MKQPNEIVLADGRTLQQLLDLHGKRTKGEAGGQRANLRGADLRGANLRGADLRDASLYGADLRGADLRDASLYGADLRGASLYGADLRDASLYGADLYGADLRGADLRGAKFKIAEQELTVNDTQSNFTILVGSRDYGYRVDGFLKIGCQEHTIEHWLENVRAIAEKHHYTPTQIDEYEDLVAFVALRAGF
jgi:hypothetical protein